MAPPDCTDNPSEWEVVPGRTPLWRNKIYVDAFSTDHGKTFTVSTERYDPDCHLEVYPSRKV